MNLQTKIKELKKGDIVSLISSDSRHFNEETKIISNGKKFITVETTRDHQKYDRETLRCVDWGSWDLFPGTLSEYTEYLNVERKRREITKEICQAISKMDLEDLGLVQDFIKRIPKK